MYEQESKIKKELIRHVFNDPRHLEDVPLKNCLDVNNETLKKGDLLKTDDGEFVFLDVLFKDFTIDSLVDYIEMAEEIFYASKKRISIYLVCPDGVDVRVKEREIKSDAEFTIKLAKTTFDFADETLKFIKQKIENRESIDREDIEMLKLLPMKCRKEMRNYYRRESLKLLEKMGY